MIISTSNRFLKITIKKMNPCRPKDHWNSKNRWSKWNSPKKRVSKVFKLICQKLNKKVSLPLNPF
jgi:hypothetical protein